MTNENAKNCPRYPLDRRCVRTPVNGGGAPGAPVRGGADGRSDAVCAALKDDMTLPRNPFGSAFG